jgi:CubicO group peptidase (beta-lactamase class C family)
VAGPPQAVAARQKMRSSVNGRVRRHAVIGRAPSSGLMADVPARILPGVRANHQATFSDVTYLRVVTPTSSPRLDPKRLDRAFELVARQVAGGRATYAALAVARSDGVVRSAAYLGDDELDSPRRTTIASITKPFTATAILQLVEAGSLVLTEPLTTYLPDFQPEAPVGSDVQPEPITTWHVLTHTAGLTDAPSEFFLTVPPTLAAMVERLNRDRLRFLPGTTYAYTSDSFYLLAELIERLSGTPYPEFLRDRIFEPLGMKATMFDPSLPGPAALPLEGTVGPPGVPYDVMIAYFIALAIPGGGLWSTTDDLVRFGRAMLGGGTLDGTRILGRPFVDLMVRHHTNGLRELGTGRSPIYGLGWSRPGLGRGSPASPSAFGHKGASGSELIVDPANDLVVVSLRNQWGVASTATDEAVQAVYAAID